MADRARRAWPALLLAFGSPPSDALCDRLALLLDEVQSSGLEELEPGRWRVFFPTSALRDTALCAIRASDDSAALAVDRVDIVNEGWAERAQASLRAITVGGLVVAPPWDLPDDRRPVIVIEPSVAFGTGHHASTRLCLSALQRLALDGRTIVDLGTGSAVLAIAAARLGARRVLAVDDDEDAAAVAHLNVARNNVEARVEVVVADLRAIGPLAADVVLGNLTGGLIIQCAAWLSQSVRPAGALILGGFTLEEERAVLTAFEGAARLLHREEEDEWVVLTFERLG